MPLRGRNLKYPFNFQGQTQLLGHPLVPAAGDGWLVDTANGNDGNVGTTWDKALKTIAKGVSKAGKNDVIYVAPGKYAEAEVTIGTAKSGLQIVGVGGRGSAFLEPAAGVEGMTVNANDVTLINLGVGGNSSADYALRVYGARFRAIGCKFEGPTGDVVRIGPQTVAGGAASGVLTGGDGRFEDCEFAWGGNGIVITSSDYGQDTETMVKDCFFHDLTGDELDENDAGANGAGGNIWVVRCQFFKQQDGTAPTKFVDLDSVGSTGIITGCYFDTTVHASSLIALASGVKYVGNYAEQEGPSTGGGTNGRPD